MFFALLAVVALVAVPLSLVVTRMIAARSQPRFTAQWRHTGELNSQVEEAFTGHELVTVFGRRGEVEARFAEKNEELFQASFGAQFMSGLVMPVMMFVGNLNYVLVAVVGGLRVATGQRVQSVSAMTATLEQSIDVEDLACACLQLEDGATGTLRGGYLLDPFPGYDCADLIVTFEGSAGSLAYVPNGLSEWKLRLRSKAPGYEWAAEGAPVEVAAADKNGYGREFLAEFLQAHERGTQPPATQHDALYVLKVAEAVYASAQSGSRRQIAW